MACSWEELVWVPFLGSAGALLLWLWWAVVSTWKLSFPWAQKLAVLKFSLQLVSSWLSRCVFCDRSDLYKSSWIPGGPPYLPISRAALGSPAVGLCLPQAPAASGGMNSSWASLEPLGRHAATGQRSQCCHSDPSQQTQNQLIIEKMYVGKGERDEEKRRLSGSPFNSFAFPTA